MSKFGIQGLGRLLRGETLKLRELEYIQAAQAFGVSDLRIILRHILPNLMHIVIIALVSSGEGLSFGPALVDGGEIVEGIEEVEVDTNFGNHSIQGEQPRTGIGVIDDNHFVFVVVDGRSEGYSKGVTMTEFAQIFQDLGATVAYNLDGGGSSTMYFNGELVNDPLGKGQERGTSDILYLA